MNPKNPVAMMPIATHERIARRKVSLRSASVKVRNEFVSSIMIAFADLIAGPQSLPHSFHQPCNGAEDEADNVYPMLVQPLVEKHAAPPPDKQSTGQDDCNLRKLFRLHQGVGGAAQLA
jgi:hypothetical protein